MAQPVSWITKGIRTIGFAQVTFASLTAIIACYAYFQPYQLGLLFAFVFGASGTFGIISGEKNHHVALIIICILFSIFSCLSSFILLIMCIRQIGSLIVSNGILVLISVSEEILAIISLIGFHSQYFEWTHNTVVNVCMQEHIESTQPSIPVISITDEEMENECNPESVSLTNNNEQNYMGYSNEEIELTTLPVYNVPVTPPPAYDILQPPPYQNVCPTPPPSYEEAMQHLQLNESISLVTAFPFDLSE